MEDDVKDGKEKANINKRNNTLSDFRYIPLQTKFRMKIDIDEIILVTKIFMKTVFDVCEAKVIIQLVFHFGIGCYSLVFKEECTDFNK